MRHLYHGKTGSLTALQCFTSDPKVATCLGSHMIHPDANIGHKVWISHREMHHEIQVMLRINIITCIYIYIG